MNRHIWLRDCAGIPLPVKDGYSAEHISQARAALVARGLRFDNKTGVKRDNDGWLSRPSNYTHEPHVSVEEVMQWEFSCSIYNSAQRIKHGYKP